MQLLKRMRMDKPNGPRKGFWRDDNGVTAVEFAFIGPLFFFMLFTVLETGLVLFGEYVLQTSVQEAARLVRTGQAQTDKLSAANFKTKVCALAGMLIRNCSTNVTVYMRSETDFATLVSQTPSYLLIGPPSEPDSVAAKYECGSPSEAMALIATYDQKLYVAPFWVGEKLAPANFMQFLGNRAGKSTRRSVAFAIFKNEPFPAVAGNVCPPVGA